MIAWYFRIYIFYTIYAFRELYAIYGSYTHKCRRSGALSKSIPSDSKFACITCLAVNFTIWSIIYCGWVEVSVTYAACEASFMPVLLQTRINLSARYFWWNKSAITTTRTSHSKISLTLPAAISFSASYTLWPHRMHPLPEPAFLSWSFGFGWKSILKHNISYLTYLMFI